MQHPRADKFIKRWGGKKDCLIEMMHDIQNEYNYLPEDILVEVSERLKVPLAQIYGIATFYKAFSLTPRGKHQIGVCMGTPCHVKGASLLVEAIGRHLGIKEGETTKDLKFSLATTGCVGTCGLAPVIVIDEEMYGNVNINQISKILKKYKK
ncbi:MAG: NAD(P)H-dependent oxidoreductase subunit E [Candidatus Cloacimonetes bacterium]|nr:NAD(P)H-dependent oxidoreductase subunit E [Candidatus Cloacimonadota bacterium]